jgi:putative membrane protein
LSAAPIPETRPAADNFVKADPRVLLAAERTHLAWVRTGLALMGFGFVVARFGLFLQEFATAAEARVRPGHSGSLAIGVGLVTFGVVVLIGSTIRYQRYEKALRSGQDMSPPSLYFGLVVATFLAGIGLVMAAYLLSVG